MNFIFYQRLKSRFLKVGKAFVFGLPMMLTFMIFTQTESLTAKEHLSDKPQNEVCRINDAHLEKANLRDMIMPQLPEPMVTVMKENNSSIDKPESLATTKTVGSELPPESVLKPQHAKKPSLKEKIRIVKKLKSLKNSIKPDQEQKRTSGAAIVGIVFGCLGFLLCWVPVLGLLFSLIGVIFSGIGLSKTRNDSNLRGRTAATIGLVFGIIGLILAVIITTVLLVALAVAT